MFIWHVMQEKERRLKHFEPISILGATSSPQLFFFKMFLEKKDMARKVCLIFFNKTPPPPCFGKTDENFLAL